MDQLLLGDRTASMMVSIIIPTYNRLELLKRAIASIEAQTFKDYELIIVDDASTDGTQEYLLNTSHKFIAHAQNMGVSAGRNSGIKASKGNYIAFLDSDDSWEIDKLEKQVAFHHANPRVRFSYGRERWIRQGKEVTVPGKYRQPDRADFGQLLEYTYIGPSSVMIEKSLLDEVGLFDETFPACEDFDLWLRAALKEPLFLAEGVGVFKYGGHKDQLSSSVLALDRYRVKALMKHLPFYREEVLAIITVKLGVLEKGARKHNNSELLEFCELITEKLLDVQEITLRT